MILSAFLINLKCRWLQSGKTPNTCIFAYGRFFTQFYSENTNCLTKLVVKYIPYRGISLSNPYKNHQLHSQLIW